MRRAHPPFVVRRPPGWRCARREIAQVSVGRFYVSTGTRPRPLLAPAIAPHVEGQAIDRLAALKFLVPTDR